MFKEIAGNQTIFMLLFAIAWGIVANVQGRWKAFQWPLFCHLKQARCRALLSFLLLNLLPFIFLGYVLWVLHIRGQTESEKPFIAITELVLQSMFPALSNFGFYRIWLGIIELNPKMFYETKPQNIRKEFRYIEPTNYRRITKKKNDFPVIYLGAFTGIWNLSWGIIYIIVASITPWIRLN